MGGEWKIQTSDPHFMKCGSQPIFLPLGVGMFVHFHYASIFM